MTKKKHSRRRFLIIPAAIILIAALVIIFLVVRQTGRPPLRQSVAVTITDLYREVSANGEIGTRESAAVIAGTGGNIRQLVVNVGDRVARGSPIAVIDEQEVLQQLQSAEATLERTRRSLQEQLITLRTAYTQAKTAYEQEKRTYANREQSHQLGSLSDEQLAAAGDALQVAEVSFLAARDRLNFREGLPLDDPRTGSLPEDKEIIAAAVEVREALAAIEVISKRLKDCTIKAGIDGIITDLQVETGSLVSPGRSIGTIHNPALLEVTAWVDEVDAGYLRLDQEVKIESDAFIGTVLAGRVSYIAPVIKRTGDARICEIKAAFPDPERVAKIGASCSIFITVDSRENVPAIPIESYFREEDKKYVFKVEKQQDGSRGVDTGNTLVIRKTEIKTGLTGIDLVEILSGLVTGDEIIRANPGQLTDGDIVRIQQINGEQS